MASASDGGARMSDCTRRTFLAGTCCAAAGSGLVSEVIAAVDAGCEGAIKPCGPASKHTTTLHAAFVRRKGEYGMRWPGQIYDGKAALTKYRKQMIDAAAKMGIKLSLRETPIYSKEEAQQWVAQAKAAKPDGLLTVLLDRQEHAWPTANMAIDTKIPTVVFAPLGAAFTTNTARPSRKPGALICSTDDFGQAIWGMKMIQARARLREMRYIVLKGGKRRDSRIEHLGTRMRTIPAQTFLDDYNRTELSAEIRQVADAYLKKATKVTGPSKQDVLNGVKSYVVARNILQREEGDGITMDCLGALGKSKVSLPCIAWGHMLDRAIPAACEADMEAATTHALVQYLFDRPGFQQDPVPETALDALIGSHCTCPTKLDGFDKPAEPYSLMHHHGMRDATRRPIWKEGQRVTVAQFVLSRKDDQEPKLIISTGEVIDNPAVPPAGGCVVAVTLKLDGSPDVLAYPGFHQIFFYGDFKRELVNYCKLASVKPWVV